MAGGHHHWRVYVADGEPLPTTHELIPSGVIAVAVGWLDPAHDYNKGSVDDEFVARLFEACRTHAVARTRGWHRCPFCHKEKGVRLPAPMTVERDSDWVTVGDAEIRVVAEDGNVACRPDACSPLRDRPRLCATAGVHRGSCNRPIRSRLTGGGTASAWASVPE
jgi:hypothetical protein